MYIDWLRVFARLLCEFGSFISSLRMLLSAVWVPGSGPFQLNCFHTIQPTVHKGMEETDEKI